MILGFVDAQDRVYDLNFATLRMRVRVEAAEAKGSARVVFSQTMGPGAVAYRLLGEVDATASVAMDHAGHAVPLLRTVPGHLYRHEGGLLFFASPPTRDPADPSFYLVKLRAMPSALKFFFEDQEGTEMISIPRDEVLRVESGRHSTTIYVSAESLALPKEKIAYAVELAPAARFAPLLDGLTMSPGS